MRPVAAPLRRVGDGVVLDRLDLGVGGHRPEALAVGRVLGRLVPPDRCLPPVQGEEVVREPVGEQVEVGQVDLRHRRRPGHAHRSIIPVLRARLCRGEQRDASRTATLERWTSASSPASRSSAPIRSPTVAVRRRPGPRPAGRHGRLRLRLHRGPRRREALRRLPLRDAAEACFGRSTWPESHRRPRPASSSRSTTSRRRRGAGRPGLDLLHPTRTEPWGQVIAESRLRMASSSASASPLTAHG